MAQDQTARGGAAGAVPAALIQPALNAELSSRPGNGRRRQSIFVSMTYVRGPVALAVQENVFPFIEAAAPVARVKTAAPVASHPTGLPSCMSIFMVPLLFR